jgi:hypothetical protein
MLPLLCFVSEHFSARQNGMYSEGFKLVTAFSTSEIEMELLTISEAYSVTHGRVQGPLNRGCPVLLEVRESKDFASTANYPYIFLQYLHKL